MKIKLSVKSPVLISSNEYLNVSEIYKDKNKIFMLDIDSLLKSNIDIKKLTDIFMNYYNTDNLNDSFNKIQDFYSKIENKENYIIKPGIEYEDLDLKKSDIKLSIGTFDKDKKIYKPYIPGSSIKGAIRNAIRNEYIRKNKIDIIYYYDYKKHMLKVSSYNFNGNNYKDLDEAIFYKEEQNGSNKGKKEISNDIFKFIEIDDFYPEEYSLKIYKIKRTKLSNNNSNGIPSYAVFIDSGTFTGNIKIGRSFNNIYKSNKNEFNKISEVFSKLINIKINDASDNTKEEIINKILCISGKYYQDILKKEEKYYNIKDYNIKEDKKILLIGFGGGIEEKTIINSLDDEQFKDATKVIKSGNRKMIHFNGRMPSTAWTIDNKKFGVLEVEY